MAEWSEHDLLASTAKLHLRDLINSVPEQVKSFLLFHIYFTTRRILFEMGGIQSEAALPGDPTFSQTENRYDVPSYKRICAKFGISPNTDFRFRKGWNHGLGKVFIYATNFGPMATEYPFPKSSLIILSLTCHRDFLKLVWQG